MALHWRGKRGNVKIVIGNNKRTKRSMARGMRSKLDCSTAPHIHDGEVIVNHDEEAIAVGLEPCIFESWLLQDDCGDRKLRTPACPGQ